MLVPWKESYDQPRQCIKKQRNYFANKSLSSQSDYFSNIHVWMLVWVIKKASAASLILEFLLDRMIIHTNSLQLWPNRQLYSLSSAKTNPMSLSITSHVHFISFIALQWVNILDPFSYVLHFFKVKVCVKRQNNNNKVTRHVWMEIIFKLIIFITITSRKQSKRGL